MDRGYRAANGRRVSGRAGEGAVGRAGEEGKRAGWAVVVLCLGNLACDGALRLEPSPVGLERGVTTVTRREKGWVGFVSGRRLEPGRRLWNKELTIAEGARTCAPQEVDA